LAIYHPKLSVIVQGDVKTLKKYCTKEMLERCTGERNAYATQGMFFDHKVSQCASTVFLDFYVNAASPSLDFSSLIQTIYGVRNTTVYCS
jgi:import inner membrane translocase subunit TIM44